jgi:hypothetical protein
MSPKKYEIMNSWPSVIGYVVDDIASKKDIADRVPQGHE